MTYIKIKVHKLDGGAGCFGLGCKSKPQVVEPQVVELKKPNKNIYIKKIDRAINTLNKSLKKCQQFLEAAKKLKSENRTKRALNKLKLYKICNQKKDQKNKQLEILKKQREQMLKDNFTNKEIRELESLQADIDAEEELDELMKQNPLTRSASEGIIKIKVLKL